MPVRPYYLDASAAVKLIVDEPGSDCLRRHFAEPGAHFMTSVCLAETLGVLKMKWLRSELSQPKYLHLCSHMLAFVAEGRVQVHQPSLESNVIVSKTKAHATRYNLDFSDAFQLVTLQQTFQGLGPGSKAVMITADRKLCDSARAEGIEVWNCLDESEPPP